MAGDRVMTRSETLTIPTYSLGAPDPNPPLDRRWGYWRTYPYPMLDDLSDSPVEQDHHALVMENDYLTINVLPDLGGHLYAFDKRTGKDIFYRPSAMKYALIAMRGAWVAGGIEFNFPVSHNPLTSSRVDSMIRENSDGSATIFIGAQEMLSRMRWTVGMTLRPGVAAIDTDIRIENTTMLPHRFYFWSNSAERVTDGFRFITPCTTVHGWLGTMNYPWHDGQYIPAYRDHRVACDLFSHNVRGDFFGCYDDDTGEGIVNVANHHEVTGRKYFTWGNSDDGLYWQDILGEEGDGPYIECQSGPFETQSIFNFMEPHQGMRWQERWYGVFGTGGFDYANRDIAISLSMDGECAITLLTTRKLVDVCLTGESDGQDVVIWEGDLDPRQPLRVPLTRYLCDEPLRVVITSTHDGVIADATIPWQPPNERSDTTPAPPGEWIDTPEGLAQAGIEREKAGEPDAACTVYSEALAKDPYCRTALVRLGLIKLSRGQAADARTHFESALSVDPNNGEISFYLGSAHRALGDPSSARYLWNARLSPHFGKIAHFALGEMAVVEDRIDDALTHFGRAAHGGMTGSRAEWAQIALLRRTNRTCEASKLVRETQREDQLNPLIAWETRNEGSTTDPTRLLGSEPEPWIEVAAAYSALGLPGAALEVISHARGVVGDDAAMFHYWAAHLHNKLGHDIEARQALDMAAGSSAKYVFPHRVEEIAILEDAVRRNPLDANAPYYLGTLLFMLGRTDEGRARWVEAATKGCTEAALFTCLGWAARKLDGDNVTAIKHYTHALDLRPNDYRTYANVDTAMRDLGQTPEERLTRLLALPPETRDKGSLPSLAIQLYTRCERFDEALSLLDTRRFHPWEGETAMRDVYLDACIGKGDALLANKMNTDALVMYGKALEYPHNIGVGKPHKPSDAVVHYRAGVAADLSGDGELSRRHFQAALAEDHHAEGSEGWLFVELCKRRLGDSGADANIQRMIVTNNDAPRRDAYMGALARIATGDSEQGFADLRTVTNGNAEHRGARRELRLLERGVSIFGS
jgi:tetratricopeptide (TPR) repeat protein